MTITEVFYLVVAGYTIYKYGRDSVTKQFKKTGGKLQYFFKTQKSYYLCCAFCWILDIIFLFLGSAATRQIYAIIRSIEPTIMSIPWSLSILRTFLVGDKHEDNKRSNINYELGEPLDSVHIDHSHGEEDAAMNKKTMDDAMRNEIVEYLLKGIRQSILLYMNPRAGGHIEEESDGIFSIIGKALFGKCLRLDDDIDDEKSNSDFRKSINSNLMASGYGDLLKHVNLIDKKSIIRESKRQVFSAFVTK